MLDDLNRELTYLTTVREKEVAEQLKIARAFGDLSENSEYDEAKNEQAKVYSRIKEVQAILDNAVLVADDSGNNSKVNLGSVVTIRDLEFDEDDKYEIVGSQEADPANGKVSDESPLGRALMGKLAGDSVEVEAPAGVIRYRIIAIERL